MKVGASSFRIVPVAPDCVAATWTVTPASRLVALWIDKVKVSFASNTASPATSTVIVALAWPAAIDPLIASGKAGDPAKSVAPALPAPSCTVKST